MLLQGFFKHNFKNKYLAKFIFILSTAIIYFAVARAGILLAYENTNVTPVWPTAGIGFALVILFGKLSLPGMFFGGLIANFTVFLGNSAITIHTSLIVSSIYGIGNVIEPVIGYLLYKKFISNIYPFTKVKNVFVFILISMVICLSNSLIGTLALTFFRISKSGFINIWFTWWIGDFAGIILISPLILSFFCRNSGKQKIKVTELIFFFLFNIIFTYIIFSGKYFPHISKILPYSLIPLILWGVFRFSKKETFINLVLIAFISVYYTTRGQGPFSGFSLNISLINFIVYIGIIAILIYFLVALLYEADAKDQALLKNKLELEKLVEKRNKELQDIKISYELAQEIANFGSWDWDIEKDIYYWSPELYIIFELHKKPIPGINTIFDLIYREDKVKIKKEIDNLLCGKIMYSSIDVKVKLKSGLEKFINLTTQVFRKEHKPVRLIGTVLDITERKILETEKEELIHELEKSNQTLKELSEMKENFLAIASHDLRSPFQNILLTTELLLEMNEATEEISQYVWMIRNSAKTQLIYINDLLDLIHLEQGQLTLYLDKIEFSNVLQNSVINMELLAQKKNIGLSYLIAGELDTIPVFIDFVKIIQVLNNLITNAVKFTNPGGNIDVTAHINENSEIEVHVSDSGIGIPEEKLKFVFDRLYKKHSYGTAGEKGTGLGLAICKNIIELHGGEIHVESKIYEGTDFWFTIPIRTEFEAESMQN